MLGRPEPPQGLVSRTVDNPPAMWTTGGSVAQDAAAEGVLLDEEDDELLSFLPEEPDDPDELSEEALLLDDASLFTSVLVSPFGTAPARLSVR